MSLPELLVLLLSLFPLSTCKDAFWNCDNVTIYDSIIDGEYLAWNTNNITLINCKIESDQGLNYIDQLEIKNGSLIHTDLAFEYVSNLPGFKIEVQH